MSSIDERVVELLFDNGQFESGVQQSIGTLEKLKASLNLDSSAKGLNDLQRAGKNFSLTNVSDNIKTVADRMSVLGIVGDQVLRRLTDSALNFGKNLLTAVPNQIISGGKARSQKITQAKFQLRGLLGDEEFENSWEEINKNITAAVKGTAYGYDAAAAVAAQLKASNVEFGEDMTTALTAISGAAAMTNSSYEEIGHIFTTVAGQGRLMTEQLNQFAYRGLNVAATLADYFETDEATLRQMVTKGKIDFATFADAMNEAFGGQAKKANDTFNGALSNVKASLSRIGAQFATPAYEDLRLVLVALLDVLGDVETIIEPVAAAFTVLAESATNAAVSMLEAIHGRLKPVADEIKGITTEEKQDVEEARTILDEYAEKVDSIKKTESKTKKPTGLFSIDGLNSTEDAAERARVAMYGLRDTYQKLTGEEIKYSVNQSITDKIWKNATNTAEKLKSAIAERFPWLAKLMGIEKEESSVVEKVQKQYEGIEELAQEVILGKYGNGEERKKALDELGVSYAVIQNKVNELLGCEKRHEVTAEDEAKMAKFLGESLEESGEKANESKTPFEKLITVLAGIGAAIEIVKGFATALFDNIIKPFVSWGVGKILSGILDVTSKIGEKLLAINSSINVGEFFNTKFKAIADSFRELGSSIGTFVTKVRNLESVQKFIASIKNLGTTIKELFTKGFDKISETFENIGKAAEEGKEALNFDWLLPIIDAVTNAFSTLVGIATFTVTAVGSFLSNIGAGLIDLFGKLKNSEAVIKLSESLTKLQTAISGLIESGLGFLSDLFSKIGTSAKEGGEKIKEGFSFDWLLKVIETVSSAFSGIIDTVSKIAEHIKTKFSESGISVEGVKAKFDEFKTAVKEIYDKITESEAVQNLAAAFESLKTAIENLFTSGIDKISGIFQDTGDKAEEAEEKMHLDWLLPIVNGIAFALGLVASALAMIIGFVGDKLTKLADGIKQIWETLKENGTIDKVSASFDKLKDSLSNLLDLGLEKITGLFSKGTEEGEETESLLDKMIPTIDSFANSISGLFDSLSNFIDLIVTKGGDLKSAISEFFGDKGVEETSKDVGKTVGKGFGAGILDGIKSFFLGDEVMAAVLPADAGEGGSSGIGNFVEGIFASEEGEAKEASEGFVGKIGSWIKDAFNGDAFGAVLKGVKAGAVGLIGVKIFKFASNLSKAGKSIKDIPSSMLDVLDDLSGALGAYQKDLKANSLLKIAMAIGIFALAIAGLTLIDPTRLGQTVGALIPLIGALIPLIGAIGAVMGLINLINGKKNEKANADSKLELISGFLDGLQEAVTKALKIAGIGVAIAGIGVAVTCIIAAMKSLNEMQSGNLLANVGIIAAVLGMLVGVAVLIDKFAKNFNASVGIGILGIAAGVLLIVKAIETLGNMDIPTLIQGGIAVVAILASLTAMSRFAGTAQLSKIGIGCAALGVGLMALIIPIELLSIMSWDTFIDGFGKFAIVLFTITSISKLASTRTVLLATSIKKMAEGFLMAAAAVVVLGVGLAAIGIGFQIFTNAIVTAGQVIVENTGLFIAGLLGLAAALLVIVGVGYLATPAAAGLLALAAVIGAVAAAAMVFVGGVALLAGAAEMFPGFGELMAGAFSGVLDSIKGTADGIKNFASSLPIIGDAIKKVFGDTNNSVSDFANTLSNLGFRGEIADELLERFANLTKLSGKDFSIAVTDLIAYIDGLEITPEEKQRLLEEYIDGLTVDAKKQYGVALDNLKASIKNIDFGQFGKYALYAKIANLLDLTGQGDFPAEVDAVIAAINSSELSDKAKTELTACLRALDDKDLTEEQRRAIINSALLWVNRFDYQGDIQSRLQAAIDKVANAEEGEALTAAVKEAELLIDQLPLSKATKETLKNDIYHAANKLTPEQRQVYLNKAWLNVVSLDWNEESKQGFVERIVDLTNLSDEELTVKYQELRAEMEAAGWSAASIQEVLAAVEALVNEMHDLVTLKYEEMRYQVDLYVESGKITGDDPNKTAQEIKDKIAEIKEAVESGDLAKANELQIGFSSWIVQNEDIDPKAKEWLLNNAMSYAQAAYDAYNTAMEEKFGELDTSLYHFVKGGSIESGKELETMIANLGGGKINEVVLDQIQLKLKFNEMTPEQLAEQINIPGMSTEMIQSMLFPNGVFSPDAMKRLFSEMGLYGPEGYKEGVEEGVGEVETAVDDMVEAALNETADAQDSNSPSEKFKELGKYAVQGYRDGITENESIVTDAITSMISNGLLSALGLSDDAADDLSKALDLGSVLTDALNNGAEGIDVSSIINEAIGSLSSGGGVSLDTMPATIDALADSLVHLQEVLSSYDGSINLNDTLGPFIQDLVAFGYLAKPVGTALVELSAAMTAASGVFKTLSDTDLTISFVDNIPLMQQGLQDLIDSFVEISSQLAEDVFVTINNILDVAQEQLEDLTDRVIKVVIELINSIVKGIVNNQDAIFDALDNIVLGIVELVSSILERVTRDIPFIGDQLADGFAKARDKARAELGMDAGKSDASEYTRGLKEGYADGLTAIEKSLSGNALFKQDSLIEKLFMLYDGNGNDVAAELTKRLGSREIDPNELINMLIPPGGVSNKDLMNRLFPDGTFDESAFKSLMSESAGWIVEGATEGFSGHSGKFRDANTQLAEEGQKAFENANGIKSPSTVYAKYGMYLDLGLVKGINQYLPIVKTTVLNMVTVMLAAMNSRISEFEVVGTNFALAFVRGINSQGDSVKSAGTKMANKAIAGAAEINNSETGIYLTGQYFSKGYVKGILSKADNARKAGRELGNAANTGVREATNTQSPSRVAMELGNYFGMGYIIGINEFGSKVYSAAHDMGETAVEALRTPLGIVSDILGSDMDMDPTIRPVMDLSDIQNGVRSINAMTPAMSVGIGTISSQMNRRKVDSNEEVISAINALREGMNTPSNVYNVNGITYDDGSNISDAVRGLIRAARVERRR